jgi:uncharacterized membrane protein
MKADDPEEKPNARLEAFCDGVFAIALTLLVLELKTPAKDSIHGADELWSYLGHLAPALFAFLLSFTVIAISWVSHHGVLRLVRSSNPRFIYANIFLLLSVVTIPFSMILLAEFGFTPAAAPAVFTYCASILLTNLGWQALLTQAQAPGMPKGEAAKKELEVLMKHSSSAFFLYGVCTVLALWFPNVVSVLISLTWVGWLLLSLREGEK